MSDCSVSYALALSDPWDCPTPPCIPDNITLESFKFSVRARGTANVGTGGVGFVGINPFNPYALSLGNTYTGVATNSTFAGTTFLPSALGVDLIPTDASQPYTNAVGYDQAYRVVGCGLKVCYSGNEMNRQGMWTLARDPSNSPIPSGTANNGLLLFRETASVPVDKHWHACLYKPATASDVTYAPRGLDIDGTATGTNLFYSGPSMIAMLSGGTPGASFQYDFIAWFEMTGRSLPMLTKSDADPLGMALVSSAVSSHQPETNPQANAVAFGRSMDAQISTFSMIDSVTSVVQKIIPLVEQAAPAVGSLLSFL